MSEGRIIELRAPLYEHLFNDLESSPDALWYIGSSFEDLLIFERVPVVGSRDVTEEGKSAAFELGAKLAINGSVVISGPSLGMDTAAFEDAISEGEGVLPVRIKCGQLIPAEIHAGVASRSMV